MLYDMFRLDFKMIWEIHQKHLFNDYDVNGKSWVNDVMKKLLFHSYEKGSCHSPASVLFGKMFLNNKTAQIYILNEEK